MPSSKCDSINTIFEHALPAKVTFSLFYSFPKQISLGCRVMRKKCPCDRWDPELVIPLQRVESMYISSMAMMMPMASGTPRRGSPTRGNTSSPISLNRTSAMESPRDHASPLATAACAARNRTPSAATALVGAHGGLPRPTA